MAKANNSNKFAKSDKGDPFTKGGRKMTEGDKKAPGKDYPMKKDQSRVPAFRKGGLVKKRGKK
jgi:hypothetical protein